MHLPFSSQVVCCALTQRQELSYVEALSRLHDTSARGGPEHLSVIIQLRAICSSGGAARAVDEEALALGEAAPSGIKKSHPFDYF